jgi:hypothetical protein
VSGIVSVKQDDREIAGQAGQRFHEGLLRGVVEGAGAI